MIKLNKSEILEELITAHMDNMDYMITNNTLGVFDYYLGSFLIGKYLRQYKDIGSCPKLLEYQERCVALLIKPFFSGESMENSENPSKK